MTSVTFMPGNAQFALEIENCFVYKFQNKIRTQIAEGVCQVFESPPQQENAEEEKTYYLKVSQFFQPIKKSFPLVRINYPNSVCYLFKAYDTWTCLSFSKGQKGLEQFGTDLGYFFNVVDYLSEMLDPNLREEIKKHFPDTIESEDISSDSKKTIRKVGMTIGFIAGKASKLVNGPTTTNALNALSERANRFSQQNISDNAKSTWKSIKQTSESINNALTGVVAPVVSLYNNLATTIGQNFYNSENKYVKAIRQYGLQISESLNEGEKRGAAQTQKKESPAEEVSAILLR